MHLVLCFDEHVAWLFLFISVLKHSECIQTNPDRHLKGVNVAYMKPALQFPGTYHAVFHDGTVKYYNASLAVDGKTSGKFADGTCTHTIGRDTEVTYWEVNLEMAYYITGIIIYNRNNDRERLSNFIIYGDNDVIHNSYNTKEYDEAEIHIQLDGTRAFSSIKIQLPQYFGHSEIGLYYLTLCEVKVIADVCRSIRKPENGHVQLDVSLYYVSQQLKIICDTGYETSSEIIYCQQGGIWSNPNPTCNPVKCPYPGKPLNGYYYVINKTQSNWRELPFSTVIVGHCFAGYECSHCFQRICQSNKSWSGQDTHCTQIFCRLPESFANGFYSFVNGSALISMHKLQYQTILRSSCNEGYALSTSSQTDRKCESDKTWTGIKPICNIVTCDFPGDINNGYYVIRENAITEESNLKHYIQDQLNFSTEIKAVCIKGYRRTSAIDIRRCNSAGFWTGEVPICSPVTCEWPIYIENGHYNAPTHPTADGMTYNTTITAVCDDKYTLSGSYRARRCNEEAIWDEGPALCKSLCTIPNVTNGQFLNVSTITMFESGTSLKLVCTTGFTPSNVDITCLDNHLWSGVNQACVELEQDSSNAAVIGGSSTAVGIVVVLIVLVLLLYRRRKASKGKKDTSMKFSEIRRKAQENKSSANTQVYEYANIHEINMRADGSQNGNSSQFGVYNYATTEHQGIPAIASSSSIQSDRAYYSFSDTEKLPTTAIKLNDLSDLILTGPDAKERFRKQFEGLPQGMVKGHKEALKPKNRGKNRYKNLYAYDDTRVVLEVESKTESDYINACFVHGFSKMRKFIASQGPTAEILDDFWKMIWQTECCKIVMLTNLKEEGKVKCEQYWPNQSSHTYGRITVSIKNTELFSQFVIRTLTMQKDDSPEKTVTQFHFTAWPDRGVPNYASSIVQFLSKVNNAPISGNGPIVVHCSAGVGRTGTFIALDNASEQGKAVGYIDVAGVVESLRKQRVSSVQTQDQYIFVYQAVAEALMLSTAALPAATFPQAFQELLQTDPRKKKRKICLEFEALKKMSPVAEECQYVSSKLVRNRRKNRYSNVLPIEEFMPSLTNEDGSEEAEYINAVFLPIKKYMQYFGQSYKEKKAFIITQTPMESTMEDFWRLVWEHDIHTMIMMNSKKEMTSSEEYWPNDSETITFGNITITNDGAEETYKHKVLSLTVKKFIVTRKIRLIQCGGWNSKKSLPESPDKILSAMELVQSWQRQTGNHTVLVHCMNGVDKSGLFCVISAVIERMKIEQDVAISHVVEEMRNAREQIIPSVEQFQFCHEAVLEFIHQYDTYSNFTA